jgi:uncharacterized SAM-binding protein YcdF (DUF218 family)
MKRRYKVLLVILATMAAGVILVAARNTLLPPLAAWLDVGQRPAAADDVMLLTGNENTRPFMAAALVRDGWAPRVLITPVAISEAVQQGVVVAPHENARQVLRYCGLESRQIVLLDGHAQSTFDEAEALAKYLANVSDRRILLVTDAFHSRRAAWIFSRVLGRRVELRSVSAPFDDFTPNNWWQCRGGFIAVSSELLKLLFYSIWYGWLGYVLAALIVLSAGLWLHRGRRAKKTELLGAIALPAATS